MTEKTSEQLKTEMLEEIARTDDNGYFVHKDEELYDLMCKVHDVLKKASQVTKLDLKPVAWRAIFDATGEWDYTEDEETALECDAEGLYTLDQLQSLSKPEIDFEAFDYNVEHNIEMDRDCLGYPDLEAAFEMGVQATKKKVHELFKIKEKRDD